MSEEIVVPDVAEPIVGYRQWSARTDGALLGHNDVLWVPRAATVARCEVGSEYEYDHLGRHRRYFDPCLEAPCTPEEAKHGGHYGHGCGIYAKRHDDARSYFTPPMFDPDEEGTPTVWGQVRMFGKVYEYEDGYRAEKAEVSCVYDTGIIAQRAAELYGVDLVPWPVETVDERVKRLTREADKQTERHKVRLAQAVANKVDPPTGSTVTADPSDPNDLGGGITLGTVPWQHYGSLREWVVKDEGRIVARAGTYKDVSSHELDAAPDWRIKATEAAEAYRHKRDHPLRKAMVAVALANAVLCVVNMFFAVAWLSGGPGSWVNLIGCLSLYITAYAWRKRRG